MDHGHYNCRDYYITPHFAPTTITVDRSPHLYRHESFDELEARSRSPASMKPKFPLLKLPLELRQQIFSYLLPRTLEHSAPNPLATHARNFSAVKKRGMKGMVIPGTADPTARGTSNVVWQRGNIHLLSVCRQLHDECAELLYGGNTFVLFVTYSGITFRFSWLLPSGLAPNRRYDFLELLPKKYMTLIKRLVINVDRVDSYTGMIKWNVSGKGLTVGLRKQVRRLVSALQPLPASTQGDEQCENDRPQKEDERRLAKVTIRVSNGNAVLDQVKSEVVRKREGGVKVNEDLEEMLEPFGNWWGVREVAVSGAVNEAFARDLEARMKSLQRPDPRSLASHADDLDVKAVPIVPLCVYGNDL